MPLDKIRCEKAIQLLIKARGSSRGNTGSTPHFESGESPVGSSDFGTKLYFIRNMSRKKSYFVFLTFFCYLENCTLSDKLAKLVVPTVNNASRNQTYQLHRTALTIELFNWSNHLAFSTMYRIFSCMHNWCWHHWNRFSGVIDTVEIVSAGSLTPLKPPFFSGVIDTVEIVSAVSLTPLKPPWSWNLKYHRDFNHKQIFVAEFQRCHWHRWNSFSGVIDTAETVSAVSMTPLKSIWHRWNRKTTLRVPSFF
jgi:hypothetical protein